MVSPIRSTLCPLGANPPFPPPPCKTPPHACMVLLALLQQCSLSSALMHSVPVLRTRGGCCPPPPPPRVPLGQWGSVPIEGQHFSFPCPSLQSVSLLHTACQCRGGGVEKGAQLLSCSMRDPQCPPHPIPSPAALYCTAHCPGGVPWSTAGLGYGVPMPSPHPPRVPFPSVRVAGGAVGNPPLCRSTALGLSLLHHSSTLTYFWLLSVCAPMWAPNLHGDFIADLV